VEIKGMGQMRNFFRCRAVELVEENLFVGDICHVIRMTISTGRATCARGISSKQR